MKNSWFGIVLIVLGVIFLLDNFGIVTFHRLLHSYWPVLLIIYGVYILLKNRKR